MGKIAGDPFGMLQIIGKHCVHVGELKRRKILGNFLRRSAPLVGRHDDIQRDAHAANTQYPSSSAAISTSMD